MYLNRLKINNFKNCKEADFDFSPGINCFVGNNGAGKTNILDAIYYLSFCKSFFGNPDSQNIMHNMDFFAIHGVYDHPGNRMEQVSCIQPRNRRKSFSVNKKEYDRLSDHIGQYPLVMISPYDRDLINEGSDVRRRYFDSVISQSDRNYLEFLITYHKALQQRNSLLRFFLESGRFDNASIEIWDEQISGPAAEIHEIRKSFFAVFDPLFRQHYKYIASGIEHVELQYESQLNDHDMASLIREYRDQDRRMGFSCSGVHKDDVSFLINGFPVKRFGSQGQQKSFVVALKMAQFDFIRKTRGIQPVLLLDDIFDKLDDERVGRIIEMVGDNQFGQVFITDTQQERISRLLESVCKDFRLFRVDDGRVSILNGT
ncbi:MAG: DNA replication/repair protein RecF [Bacteroidales bacterium]|nr:DNA replication/repair protein RecF [Bacteroidales bacterium]